MSALLAFLDALVALAPVIVKITPLLIQWWSKDAKDRAREIQADILEEEKLMAKGNEGEISKREYFKTTMLDFALRERGYPGLRVTPGPS